MYIEKTFKCQCEHNCHFDPDKLTPKGAPGHSYGERNLPRHIREVKTTYATLTLCEWCVEDCFGD